MSKLGKKLIAAAQEARETVTSALIDECMATREARHNVMPRWRMAFAISQ